MRTVVVVVLVALPRMPVMTPMTMPPMMILVILPVMPTMVRAAAVTPTVATTFIIMMLCESVRKKSSRPAPVRQPT